MRVCLQSDGQFGAGAHFCLGWPLYMAEAKSLLAIYARHYSLSLVRPRCPPRLHVASLASPV